MSDSNNPCLTCPDTCCSLKGRYGLRLSPREFEAYFNDHRDDLSVRVEDKVVVISSREGRLCPHLRNGACRIYQDRPIDCRLFPYQMMPVYETRNRVKYVLHSHSHCREKSTFLLPEEEARALLVQFCRDVYGDKKIIVEFYQESLVPRLKNRIAALVVRGCRKLGIIR